MKLRIGATDVPLQEFSFPGGEVHVRMSRIPDIASREERITIEARLHDSGSLMSLLLLTDAVRRAYASHGDLPIHLVCPYLPYARQDRVAVDGEPLSIAVLAGILNAQRYATVEVWDAHSNVSLALIDRVVHRQAHLFAKSAVWSERSKSIATAREDRLPILVAPDVGALPRVSACAVATDARVVHAEKHRDPVTGKLGDAMLHCEHVGDRTLMIVDDICDGGRTFTSLAAKLRPLTTGRLALYVTHGIFSNGFDALRDAFDAVYVANPFPAPADLPDFVHIVTP